MTRLNLLPWRDLRRQAVNRQVRNLAIFTAVLMAAVVYSAYLFMEGRIDHQNSRNTYLDSEIKKVEKELKEINNIKRRRDALIARMRVIERLQADRVRMVKIFDGLATQLPSGMYLSLFSIKGNNITLKGSADSNGTVSKFMRLIESSDQFLTPNLNIINVKAQGGLRVSNFTLRVRLKPIKKPVPAQPKKTAAKQRGGGK